MHTITHLVIGVILALFFGLNFPLTITFILVSVLIDIDHIIELKIPRRKKLKLDYFFAIKKYKKFNYQSPQKALHIFHTFEFIFILSLISFFYSQIFFVAIACLIHLWLDAVGNIWNRNLGNAGGKDWIKYWFLIYYIRKRSIFNKENF